MLPAWADSIEELRRFVFRAHGRAINAPESLDTGSSVHVGVVDSVRSLPDTVSEDLEIADERSFLAHGEPETTFHGTKVVSVLASFCPDATFSRYQVVDRDGNVPVSAYADAIDAAIEDGVDVLNVSAGDSWPGPVRSNPYCRQTRRALRNGITVVAAAGNRDPEDEHEPVNCPAAMEDVIAVSGFVTDCPAAPGDEPEPDDGIIGPYYAWPDDPSDHPSGVPRSTFCGRNGCVGGRDCIAAQTERPWEWTPTPGHGKPDVLAPVHYPGTRISNREPASRLPSSPGRWSRCSGS